MPESFPHRRLELEEKGCGRKRERERDNPHHHHSNTLTMSKDGDGKKFIKILRCLPEEIVTTRRVHVEALQLYMLEDRCINKRSSLWYFSFFSVEDHDHLREIKCF